MNEKNAPATIENKQLTPVDRLKNVMSSESVQQQFKNALKENSSLFVASVIDLFASDTYLQKCNPSLVVMECLKAATLKLPINKSLGFAYVVPYKKQGVDVPQFQLGYKGYIQLAMRTGQYQRLNDGIVYQGQKVDFDPISGDMTITGTKESEEATGYFAFFRLNNGFEKLVYFSKENAAAHGKKFSKSYSKDSSPWKTQFDAMALKTCWRKLLGKYGILSVEMSNAIANDDDETPAKDQLKWDTDENANKGDIIDMETGEINQGEGGGDPGDDDAPPPDETQGSGVFAGGPGF
jgi:recombination protein RecT